MCTIFSPILASDGGMLYAFSHSDLLGQLICIVLFIFSIFTWIVMINKYRTMRKMEEANNKFIRTFREKRSPLSLNETSNLAYCPIAAVYLAAKNKIEHFTWWIEQPEPDALSAMPNWKSSSPTWSRALKTSWSSWIKA